MPRQLTPGQQAAIRASIARRGELGLTQRRLAEKASVSERAIQNFEAARTWPNADTLARLERLGLEWPVGHITEYAAQHEARPPAIDEDIEAILASNLHPDLKIRLIDRLRAIRSDEPDVSDQAITVIRGAG